MSSGEPARWSHQQTQTKSSFGFGNLGIPFVFLERMYVCWSAVLLAYLRFFRKRLLASGSAWLCVTAHFPQAAARRDRLRHLLAESGAEASRAEAAKKAAADAPERDSELFYTPGTEALKAARIALGDFTFSRYRNVNICLPWLRSSARFH